MPVPEAFLTAILPNRVLVQDPGRKTAGQIKFHQEANKPESGDCTVSQSYLRIW